MAHRLGWTHPLPRARPPRAVSRECGCRPGRSPILPVPRLGKTRRGRAIRRSRPGAPPNPRASPITAISQPARRAGPLPHLGNRLFPLHILKTPDQIVILREASGMPRRIYTDGRHHPEGSSRDGWDVVGAWDGDTLVVDTVGTNGRARAANGVGSNAQESTPTGSRMPLSEELHLVERFTPSPMASCSRTRSRSTIRRRIRSPSCSSITSNAGPTSTCRVLLQRQSAAQRRPARAPRAMTALRRAARCRRLGGVRRPSRPPRIIRSRRSTAQTSDVDRRRPRVSMDEPARVDPDRRHRRARAESNGSPNADSQNMMARTGWKRTTLARRSRDGLVNPLLDGRPNGGLVTIMLADGTVLGPVMRPRRGRSVPRNADPPRISPKFRVRRAYSRPPRAAEVSSNVPAQFGGAPHGPDRHVHFFLAIRGLCRSSWSSARRSPLTHHPKPASWCPRPSPRGGRDPRRRDRRLRPRTARRRRCAHAHARRRVEVGAIAFVVGLFGPMLWAPSPLPPPPRMRIRAGVRRADLVTLELLGGACTPPPWPVYAFAGSRGVTAMRAARAAGSRYRAARDMCRSAPGRSKRAQALLELGHDFAILDRRRIVGPMNGS